MDDKYLDYKVYDTIDPQTRLSLAEDLLNSSDDKDFSESLNKILELRYTKKTTRNKTEYIDNFMKIWVDIAFYARDNSSDKKAKKIRDKYLKNYGNSDIVKFREENDLNKEVLYCEFRHLCRVFIYSCNESKSYSRYFDIIPIKQSKLYQMISTDLENIGIIYAEKFGLKELFPELIEASEDELVAFEQMAEKKSSF